MTSLFAALPQRSLFLLLGLFCLLSISQLLHAYYSYVRAERRSTMHETVLVLHLLSLGLVVGAAYYHWLPQPHVDFFPLHLDPSPLLWTGLALACLDIPIFLRRHLPYVLADACAMLLTIPPMLELAKAHPFYPLALSASYFLVRTITMLALDHRDGLRTVSSLSISDALRVLPTGVLFVDERGNAVFGNDTMGTLLLKLGIASVLTDVSDLLALVPATWRKGAAVLVTLPDEESYLLERGDVSFLGRQRTLYLATEVTELIDVERDLEQANDELRATQAQLIEALGNVRQLAENEALLHMQVRVHDVVGQRLSIMHRALEDGNVSDATIAELIPVITSAVQDLSDTSGEAGDDLAGIVHAFALAGTDIRIEGSLPGNPAIAQVFTQVVREAATNAVRHAHAERVDVSLADEGTMTTLVVANDVSTPIEGLDEGTGVPGMRHAVESLGGTFEVSTDERFTIRASVPMGEGEPCAC